ncbi:hypothetical protein DTPHA_602860 [Enterococcus faecium]|uniref:Uncharacterized protein n=1 Tax=Enterococcus faecium TaxID=1352 RepID=A0ABD7LSD9_ENTFC|nr:hypothetical protein [Enterococcus faecium]SAM53703.1 hypothetical protein DTPHA_602860 [Enterococcus faecium]
MKTVIGAGGAGREKKELWAEGEKRRRRMRGKEGGTRKKGVGREEGGKEGVFFVFFFFFFQAEDGIRVAQDSRGLGDVYKRQALGLLGLALTACKAL